MTDEDVDRLRAERDEALRTLAAIRLALAGRELAGDAATLDAIRLLCDG